MPIISWPGPGLGVFGTAFYRICNISPFLLSGNLSNLFILACYWKYVDIALHIKVLMRGSVGAIKPFMLHCNKGMIVGSGTLD